MSLHPALGFTKGPANQVGGVLVLVVLGPCVEFGDEQ